MERQSKRQRTIEHTFPMELLSKIEGYWADMVYNEEMRRRHSIVMKELQDVIDQWKHSHGYFQVIAELQNRFLMEQEDELERFIQLLIELRDRLIREGLIEQ